jgi:predicted membrane protein
LAEIFSISTDELLGVIPSADALPAEVIAKEDTRGLHAQLGNWNFHLDGGRKTAVGFAVFVLLTGLLMLLSGLLRIHASFWSILWPCALLCFGIFGLWPKFSFLRLGCTVFALYFLLNNLYLLPFTLGGEILFPAAAILLGLALLVDALKKPRHPTFQFESGDNKFTQTLSTADGYLDYSASFGEAVQAITMDTLHGGQIHTNFGEYTVNLADVAAVAPDCNLELHCSFGELNLLVPKRFTVRPKSSTSFAAVDVSGEPNANPDGYIDADVHVAFGSVNIQYI